MGFNSAFKGLKNCQFVNTLLSFEVIFLLFPLPISKKSVEWEAVCYTLTDRLTDRCCFTIC